MSKSKPTPKNKKPILCQRIAPKDEAAFDFWSEHGRSEDSATLPTPPTWPKEFPEMIGKALAYAAKKHSGQVRTGTSVPYLSHPMAVAAIVFELGGPPDAVIGALLHDVVEDNHLVISREDHPESLL
ncbi:HD domain-containing protein [Bdellovibrionota bacterium FG-1]